MNSGKKSRKLLLTSTVLTIAALASLLTVYAVLIGNFEGGIVTVGGASGTVLYSKTNDPGGTWAATLEPSSSDSWFTKMQITYSGPVTITWQLQTQTGPSTWANVTSATVITTMTLSGTPQDVYASPTGSSTGNQDWKTYANIPGSYHITVNVASA